MHEGQNHSGESRDVEFRDYVVSTLARLDLNMTILVGKDGNNGRMQGLEERLDSAESRLDGIDLESAKKRGFRKALDLAFLFLAWLAGVLSQSHDWFKR